MIRLFQIFKVIVSVCCRSRANRPKAIRRACEQLGPIFIKLGQFLSTRPELLSAALSEELNRLQDQVEISDLQVISDAFQAQFKTFDPKPFSVASLAQVHAAELQTGESVVVKILRPGLARQIQTDLTILKRVAWMSIKCSKRARQCNLLGQILEFEKILKQEVDLLTEAAHAEKLRHNFMTGERATWLSVPKVYWEYSDPTCLVLERFHGIKINEIARLKTQGINLDVLATRGVEIFFTQVFEDRFFHADMHPGNILVCDQTPDNPKYLGVDFGIMGHLSRLDRLYLVHCFLSFFRQDYTQLARVQIQHGWVPADTDVFRLEIALRRIVMPLHHKKFMQFEFSKVLGSLLKLGQEFRMNLKPQFFLLQKTLVNVEGLGRQLAPELDLWTTAKPFLERWWRTRHHPNQLIRGIQKWLAQAAVEFGVQSSEMWGIFKEAIQVARGVLDSKK